MTTLDLQGKVIRFDTKAQNFTARFEKDLKHLNNNYVSSYAELCDGLKWYPVKLTNMHFTVEWIGSVYMGSLDVDFSISNSFTMPLTFDMRFYLLDEEEAAKSTNNMFEVNLP